MEKEGRRMGTARKGKGEKWERRWEGGALRDEERYRYREVF